MSSPIIVVTGATGGVGFGICQRLLFQLSHKNPPDAQPRFNHVAGVVGTLDGLTQTSQCEGLTLILACRNTTRADATRKKLYEFLDTHIQKQRKMKEYDGYADIFRKKLKIEVHHLDLTNMQSVFRFANEMPQKYPYISHLICNAGAASFVGIDVPLFIIALVKNPVEAVTRPTYSIQRTGERSADGLGWLWQSNVFGHYALVRGLQPLLLASNSPLGSRVIWMSSFESSPEHFDLQDLQLTKTEHPYETSKYQMDLLSAHFDLLALQKPPGAKRIRHFRVEPGVTSTAIMDGLSKGWFMRIIRDISFYLARLFGSPHHCIVPFTGAIAAVHIALVAFCFIPTQLVSNDEPHPLNDGSIDAGSPPLKFDSRTGRWGDSRVGIVEVREWKKNEARGAKLLQECEELYQSFLRGEAGTLVIGSL